MIPVAVDTELLHTLHLPLMMLARQRLPLARPAGSGAAALLAGEEALAAMLRAAASLRAGPGNVFHGAGMMRAASERAQAAQEPVLAARLRHGATTTVLPLRITRRHGVTRAVDLTAPLGQYSDTIGRHVTADDIVMLARQLRSQYGVDVVEARRVRADSDLAGALAAAGARRHAPQSAPFIDLTAFRDFSEYDAQASRHTRRNRKQRRRKLADAHGPLAFSVVPAREHRDVLRMAIGWKREWLGAHGHPNIVFDGAANEDALLRACDDPHAHLSLLRAGDTLAAVELGFSAGAYYAAYLGSYNPALASYSVGQEQMLRTIAWCFEQGFARYDLLAPADDYKRGWARGSAVAVHDYCLPLSPVGAGHVFARRYGRPLARRCFRALPAGWRRKALRWRSAAAADDGR